MTQRSVFFLCLYWIIVLIVAAVAAVKLNTFCFNILYTRHGLVYWKYRPSFFKCTVNNQWLQIKAVVMVLFVFSRSAHAEVPRT